MMAARSDRILDHEIEDPFPFKLALPVQHFLLDPLRPNDTGTSRQVAMAAMGIITELVRKSKKSRNCMPMIVTPASGP